MGALMKNKELGFIEEFGRSGAPVRMKLRTTFECDPPKLKVRDAESADPSEARCVGAGGAFQMVIEEAQEADASAIVANLTLAAAKLC